MTASAATIEFLDQLRIRGVEIWVEGERLLEDWGLSAVVVDDCGRVQHLAPGVMA